MHIYKFAGKNDSHQHSTGVYFVIAKNLKEAYKKLARDYKKTVKDAKKCYTLCYEVRREKSEIDYYLCCGAVRQDRCEFILDFGIRLVV